MKKHSYFGLIGLMLFVGNVMYSGGEALADSRIAACFSKTRGLVNIIKNELEPTDSLVTPELTNKCKKLRGTLVIWAKEGATGPAGSIGLQGLKGDKGDQGEIGATGPVGATGSTGATGATGSQGLQGIQGPKGDRGDQGPSGTPCSELVHENVFFNVNKMINYIAPVGQPCTSTAVPPVEVVASTNSVQALRNSSITSLPTNCQHPNAGQNLAGCDLTDPSVSFDFVGRDLRGANLVEANLTALDLAFFNFSGANLVEATLTGTNFYTQNAENKAADFSFTNLSGANLSNAKLPFANLNGARLDSVNFSGADLCGAKFSLSNSSAPEIMPQPIDITWSNGTICPNGEAPISQSGVLQCVGQQLVPTEICS